MNYELADKLRDAGFPTPAGYLLEPDGEFFVLPTLSELIAACGEICFILVCINKRKYVTHKEGDDHKHDIEASTPEEAVANLWLALNKKI